MAYSFRQTDCVNKVITEDAFHTWDVRTGTVRINDDAGEGPDMPYADAVAQLSSKTISVVKVSAGFSAGQNLRVTLAGLKVGGKTYDFAS